MSTLFGPQELAQLERHLTQPAVPTGYQPPQDFPRIRDAKKLSLDLETHDPTIMTKGPGSRRDGYVVGVGLRTDDGLARYYPLRHVTGPNCDPEQVMGWLRDELGSFHNQIVGANVALYDGDYLQCANVRASFAKWRDVQWAEALLDETALSYSLETLGRKYLKESKATDFLKGLYGPDVMKHMREVHPAHAETYSLQDTAMPLAILQKQEPLLKADGLTRLYNLECRLTPLLLYMKALGTRMDLEKAEVVSRILIHKRNESLGVLENIVGFPVDPESGADIARACELLGVPYQMTDPTPSYPSGQPSFRKEWIVAQAAKDWLEELDPVKGFFTALHNARRFEKARNPFITNYILGSHINGRIHAEFNPLRRAGDVGEYGTESGRFSSSHPNLQNIPSHDDFLAPLLRSLFLPDEGMQFYTADYCLDPNMRALTSDLHWVPVKNLTLGTELVGFDEQVPFSGKGYYRRHLRPTKVTGLRQLLQPCVKIITDKGTVICSTQHRWLARSKTQSCTFAWTRAQDLAVGSQIQRLCGTWQEDRTHSAGYLAGIFDGEGWVSNGSLGFGQNPGYVLDKTSRLLKEYGFNFEPQPRGKYRVQVARLNGGREKTWEFLGKIRPERLIENNKRFLNGPSVHNYHTQAATILAIENIGKQPVVAVQTSTKTLVIEGMLSHNSQIEFRLLVNAAVKRNCPGAQEALNRYIQDPTTDFHNMVVELTGLPRKYAKNINFGLAFTMGVRKLAQNIGQANPDGSPNQKALDAMEQYHKRVPFVRDISRKASDSAQVKGYMRTLLGRRSRFNLWEYDGEYGKTRSVAVPYEEATRLWKDKIRRAQTHKALNRYTQGSSADLTKLAMVKAWERGMFSNGLLTLALTIHDELAGSKAFSAEGDKALADLKELMQEEVKGMCVPILVEAKTGSNWWEAK